MSAATHVTNVTIERDYAFPMGVALSRRVAYLNFDLDHRTHRTYVFQRFL